MHNNVMALRDDLKHDRNMSKYLEGKILGTQCLQGELQVRDPASYKEQRPTQVDYWSHEELESKNNGRHSKVKPHKEWDISGCGRLFRISPSH